MTAKVDKDNLDIEKQIRFLESLDSKSCENAKQALCILVQHGRGIAHLVNYFCASRSERALEILYRVTDPHHKILLDTLIVLMKEKKLPEVVVLLGQIMQRQPSWVNQVVKHSLFKYIIEYLRTTKPIVARDVISGMFFMAILLPLCTDTPQSSLQGFFNFFIHGCETLALLIATEKEEKNPEVAREKSVKERLIKGEVCPEHCGVALREYFQALYGIFPIQFVSFLKQMFTDKPEKKQAIAQIVKALMNGVRLHPNLIFHTKEWEQSSQRYENKTDAAYFLDQIRQMVVGVIPVPVDFEEDSELGSASFDGPSSKGLTFSFPPLEEESASSNGAAWMDESADLLEMINTPGGSRPGSPTRKPTGETSSPIVLTSEPRSRKPSGEVVRTSRFGSISNSISTMLKRSERKSVTTGPGAIEIERGNEEGRRDSTCDSDLLDEAEDALDDLPTLEIKEIADRRKFYDPTPSSTSAPSPSAVEQVPPKPSPVSSPVKELLSPIPSEDKSRRTTAEDIAEEAKQTTASLMEAAKAARLAVQERKRQAAEQDQQPEQPTTLASIRSRSASLKPLGVGGVGGIYERERTSTMAAGFLQNAAESDGGETVVAPESTDGRSRFSVTSYFSKLNRQRFVSECPQRVELPIAEQAPVSARARTLERTSSCPDLVQQEPVVKDGPFRAPALQLHQRNKQLPESPKAVNFYDQHPYLKRYQPLEMKYFHNLEERFAARQDKKLGSYMEASRVYHKCLKDLGLADRLPGRIYDDLTNIAQGVSLEKQRDMLRARLQLVNQHLMYERSCRLLHALRNRRLFVQITGENSLKAQLHSERQQNFTIREEVASLRAGLTSKRRELILMKRMYEGKNLELQDEHRILRMESYRVDLDIASLKFNQGFLERRELEARLGQEANARRADDLEEIKKRQEAEILVLNDRVAELRRAHEENNSLKQHILMLESADRLRSPDVDERQKQLLSMELDKATREREKERLHKEELREKNTDLEHCLKTEQARAEKFASDLARSARILREQNEAAEQKFLSLQLINEQHLQLINELHVELETAKDAEAAFLATIKNVQPSDIPPEPIPSLLGTTTTDPTTSFPPPSNTGDQAIFQFDEDPNLHIDI